MIDDFLEHEDAIGRAALARLARPESYPGLPVLERSAILLRLFRFEGVGRYWVWIVVPSHHEYTVRRVMWDRPGDYRPAATTPTTFGSDAVAQSAEIDARLAQLQACLLHPFVRTSIVGLDGVNFGVEYGTYFQRARLCWWSGAAADWHALQEWFDAMVKYLDDVLPSGA
jgi:hypothetical protein